MLSRDCVVFDRLVALEKHSCMANKPSLRVLLSTSLSVLFLRTVHYPFSTPNFQTAIGRQMMHLKVLSRKLEFGGRSGLEHRTCDVESQTSAVRRRMSFEVGCCMADVKRRLTDGEQQIADWKQWLAHCDKDLM